LPTADLASRFVKDSFVVFLADLFTGVRAEQLPQRFVLVVDPEIFFLSRRSDLVCAEEKTIRITIDDSRRLPGRFRCGHNVLRYFVPRDIEMHVLELRVVDDLLDDCSLIFNWTNDPADADMGPDKRRVGMAPEERLHLGRISRFGAGLCEWDVDVVVNQDHQTNLSRKIDEPIEGLVLKTRNFAGDLC